VIAEDEKDDWYDGKLVTWEDGTAKKVYILTVDTNRPEPGRTIDSELGDNGLISVWVRGNLVKVLKDAARAAGVRDIVGAYIKAQHNAMGEKQRGKNPPKLYQAKLTPGELPREAVGVLADSTQDTGGYAEDEKPF
jgi:hypothetical protein